MEISGIDKLKVNNAIIVFLLVAACVFCPIVLLLVVDYKFFFDKDIVKVIIACLSFGGFQFGICYINACYTTLTTFIIEHLNKEIEAEFDKQVNKIIRMPLLRTIGLTFFIYGSTIPVCFIFNYGLLQMLKFYGYLDVILVTLAIIQILIALFKAMRAARN